MSEILEIHGDHLKLGGHMSKHTQVPWDQGSPSNIELMTGFMKQLFAESLFTMITRLVRPEGAHRSVLSRNLFS